MKEERVLEVFAAGCRICHDFINQVEEAACASCEIRILDMHDPVTSERGKTLGITSLPAVVIDGTVISDTGLNLNTLKAAGLGVPIK